MKIIAALLLLVSGALAQTPTPLAPVADGQLGFYLASSLQTCMSTATNTLCIYGTGATPGLALSISRAVFVPFVALNALPSFTATATTLPAGSKATATVNGTTFNFGIPQGAQGPAGATGPQGPPGIGGVATVNGKAPDSTGNVKISATTTSSTILQ